MAQLDFNAEWLEADGLGGFASGTVGGRRTRRYHALLLTATTPPTGRCVLAGGIEALVTTPAGTFPLSTQFYEPGVVHPCGEQYIESFAWQRFPAWTFRLPDRTRVSQEIFVPHERAAVVLRWRLEGADGRAKLMVRPLLSGRDYHHVQRENSAFRFDADVRDDRVRWQTYGDVPAIVAWGNGRYVHEPLWFRQFLYAEERDRGLDHVEDLGSPGAFEFDLERQDAVLVLTAEGRDALERPRRRSLLAFADDLRAVEMVRRLRFATPLDRAADAYLARRGAARTIVAGYPWFTDWGRDTFIALRGLCLATGRLDEAEAILVEWAGAVSDGMLPNRFPDRGDEPEYNSVDASLWYIVAVHEFLEAAGAKGRTVSEATGRTLRAAVEAILDGYTRGTRFGIRAAADGLLRAGQPDTQLTWMDARVGDWVVTPRVGKPVEVQALWLNALWIAGRWSERWQQAYERGREVFVREFWNEAEGCLFDVIEVDHQAGVVDASFRPNQAFAVGGLPVALLEGARARRVVDALEGRLWTPLGPRTLAPGSPDYRPECRGGVRERDGAYHQGTVWPWLAGAFVEAWVRVRGSTAEAKRRARQRFLGPLLAHLDTAGLGHISEAADGDPPHTPRGCPFQAWSLGELLRLERLVLAER